MVNFTILFHLASSIAAANQEVSKVLPAVSTSVTELPEGITVSSLQSRKQPNYTVLHGTSSALRHSKLKCSTANNWKNAVIKQKINASQGLDPAKVAVLVGKNRST